MKQYQEDFRWAVWIMGIAVFLLLCGMALADIVRQGDFRGAEGLPFDRVSCADSEFVEHTTVPPDRLLFVRDDAWRKRSDITTQEVALQDSCTGPITYRAVYAVSEPPSPVVPAPVVTLTAFPLSVTAGKPVTLIWTVANNAACHATWDPEHDVTENGSIVIIPPQSISYALGCNSLPDFIGPMPPTGIARVEISVFTPPLPPGCYPFLTPSVTVHDKVAIDGLTVSAFGCSKETGFIWRTTWRHGSLADIVGGCAAAGLIAAINEQAIDSAWVECLKQPHTPATQVVADELTTLWKPHWEVDRGTTGSPVATRQVYTKKPDGSRGAQLRLDAAGNPVLTGGTLQTIASTLPCNGISRLIDSVNYNLVFGQISVQGKKLPLNSFSRCKQLNPPATGWPQT